MQPEVPAPVKKVRPYWILGVLVVAVLVGAGVYVFTLLKPEFEVSINYPPSLTVGQRGELEVRVRNRGDRPGIYQVEIGIGDNVWKENVWVGAGSENVLRYPFTASAVGPLRVRAGDKVGQIWVNPVILPGGMTMAGTVGTPVNWLPLENLSGSGKAPEKPKQ
jgi:uncharacterized protein (DUF58 family)